MLRKCPLSIVGEDLSMTRAIKIESLKQIDKTSVQILQVISLKLGDKNAAFIDYKIIALSLNIERDTVRKAVNRMLKNKILKIEDGKISIPGAVFAN